MSRENEIKNPEAFSLTVELSLLEIKYQSAIVQRDVLLEALKSARQALNDWSAIYAPNLYDKCRVRAARARKNANGGALAYMGAVAEKARAAIALCEKKDL